MTAVFLESIAELDRKNRELTARVTALEDALTEVRERLNVQGMLLTTPNHHNVARHYAAQLARLQEAA